MIEKIQVDISRSFKGMSQEVSSENLVNLLHAYAVEDPSMEYCQGMNFIMGFLYIVTREEDTSFAIFKQMMSKLEMLDLMNTETPKLKSSFYRLDRLISICLPDMH